jgi:triosephosphate isomerase (TIM)
MIKACGCSHVLVGHSERRQYFEETNETVLQRTVAALDAGLTPIVCVGERLGAGIGRNRGRARAAVSRRHRAC